MLRSCFEIRITLTSSTEHCMYHFYRELTHSRACTDFYDLVRTHLNDILNTTR